MTDFTLFRQWLKHARQVCDLTQEQLAEHVSCATPTLRKIEQGTRRPSRELAELLADALHIAANERAAFVQLARTPIAPEYTPVVGAPPEDRPPAPAVPHIALPAAPTPLIGRQAECADLRQQLADPACRLVTLLGPGGIGKSRLALQVATELAAHQPGTVVWVELAPVTLDQVAGVIAEVVGCPLVGVGAPDAQLLAFLRARELLLVLDNLEHVLDAVPLLQQIIQQSPGIRPLVTSRTRLHIQEEWLVEVRGLPTPIADTPSLIAQSAAVLLFLERARHVVHTFALDPANQADIARICRLLDGMPLAIELAAAWVRLLACGEIADEIARGMDLLATSARDIPARQRSIRTVFDHAWAGLPVDEQDVLRKLTVFRGGFSRAAAEQVAGATLLQLAALVDTSLLRRSGGASATRYDLHPLVQQYAADALTADPPAEATARDRHGRFYAALLQRQLPSFHGPDATRAYAALLPDMENVRQAWAWGAAQANIPLLKQMIVSLQTICEDRGWLHEGHTLFAQAATALRNAPLPWPDTMTQLLGNLLGHQGYFAARGGALASAHVLLHNSLDLLHGDGAALARADTLMNLSMVSYQSGRYPEAAAWVAESLRVADQHGAAFLSGLDQCLAGMVALAQGRYADARADLERALRFHRSSGSPRMLSLNLCYLGRLELAEDQVIVAQTLGRAGLQVSSLSHDRWGVGTALAQLGRVALAQHDAAEARYLSREAGEIFAALGERWSLGLALLIQAQATRALGKLDEAAALFRRVAHLATASQLTPLVLEALLGLAAIPLGDRCVAEQGDLLACIVQHPATEHAARAQATRILDALAIPPAPPIELAVVFARWVGPE